MKLRYTAAWVGCTVAALMVTYAAGIAPGGAGRAEAEVPEVSSESGPGDEGAALPLPTPTAAAH
jgi:hypothetical protein